MIPIDTIVIGCIGNFVLGTAWAVTLIGRSNQMRRARRAERTNKWLAGEIDVLKANNLEMGKELTRLERREFERRQHLRKAGIAGGAATRKLMAERRAEAQAKTHTELAASLGKMRTRAQVVAPVKAKRTRAKNSGAVSAT